MSKNGKSACRLYYTFGTVFLMAVITVCAMNFSKDSRIMNRPAVTASTESASARPDVSADTGQTETKQSEAKKTKNKQTKTEQTKTEQTSIEQTKTEQDGTVNGSGTNEKTQVNPGEEP
jgi:hypothetical protein